MGTLADLHTHSRFSFDAGRDMTFANMCASALEAGVGILAVTDHYDIGFPYKFDPAEREEEFLEAKETYAGRVDLLRGIELGEMLDGREEAERIRNAVPFDVILGSLHGLRPEGDFCYLDYAHTGDGELLSLWERYLEGLAELAANGDFDVLTHIRYPERYFIRAGRGHLLDISARGKEDFAPVFRELIRRDIALEINTSVVRKFGFPADPGPELLKLYREMGGKRISLGSDAHRRDQIGADIRAALDMAAGAGFEEMTVFAGRQKRQISIREAIEQ